MGEVNRVIILTWDEQYFLLGACPLLTGSAVRSLLGLACSLPFRDSAGALGLVGFSPPLVPVCVRRVRCVCLLVFGPCPLGPSPLLGSGPAVLGSPLSGERVLAPKGVPKCFLLLTSLFFLSFLFLSTVPVEQAQTIRQEFPRI